MSESYLLEYGEMAFKRQTLNKQKDLIRQLDESLSRIGYTRTVDDNKARIMFFEVKAQTGATIGSIDFMIIMSVIKRILEMNNYGEGIMLGYTADPESLFITYAPDEDAQPVGSMN